MPVLFDGYRFATKNSDSYTHYTIKRSVEQNRQLGFVTEVQNNPTLYPEAYKNREVYIKVGASRDLYSDILLLRSTGERITNGTSAANISYVLTEDKKPGIYMGKSPKEGSTITTTIPLDEIKNSEFIQKNNGNLLSLVGQAVYMPDFFIERPTSLFDVFTDAAEFMFVTVADFVRQVTVTILDSGATNLPPLLSEINNFPPIFTTTDTAGRLNGNFVFKKDSYQRFWGQSI